MKVRYSAEAIACIASMGRHYRAINPIAAAKIRADIRATVERIRTHPQAYALIGRDDIGRAVTRKYAYLIYFRLIDEKFIAVVSIRHGAEQPRFPVERS